MPIENRLSQLIEEKGLSMYALAKQANLTYPTVFNLAHKKTTRIDLETLDKLCTALDATPDQIFHWTRESGAGEG